MASYNIDIYANDRTGRSLSNIEKQLGSINSRGRAVAGTLAGLATGAVARGIINQYRSYEKYNTVLRTYLGSQAKATSELNRLQKLANRLPQDLDDVTNAFTIFTRAGIDTSSKSLSAFSNIATANGKSLTQLGEAVADALTGEFERLKEFGIKVSKENGKFVADIGNGQSIIASSSADLVRQLKALGEEGGKFGQAAANNAGTLNQSLSNLQGAIFSTSLTIGEQLAPALILAADLTADWLTNHEELIKALSTRIGKGLVAGVEAISRALPVIADNIELVRAAAVSMLTFKAYTAAAQGFRQLGFVISDVRREMKKFAGGAVAAKVQTSQLGQIVGNLAKKIATVAGGFRNFAGSFVGLAARVTGVGVAVKGLASLAPLLANPFVLAAAAIAAAVYGAFKYFEDESIKIAGLQTTVGEVVEALWWKTTTVIKEYWASFVNFVGNAVSDLTAFLTTQWQAVKEAATAYIEPIAAGWQWVVNTVGGYVETLVDNVIGGFVFIGKAVWETVKQIPEFFMAVFSSIKTMVLDFAGRIVRQFGNIGEAIKTAIAAPFTDATLGDAITAATRNAFEGMGAVVSEEWKAIGKTSPDWGRIAGESFTGGYSDAIGEGMGHAALAMQVAGQAVSDAAATAWTDTKTTVAAAAASVGTSVRGVVEEYRGYQEATATAAISTAYYDDAILRLSRNQEVAVATTDELTTATKESGKAALTAAQEIAYGLSLEQAKYNNLNAALSNTSAIQALSKAYGVSADLITSKLREARNSITDFHQENVSITGIIGDTWAEMGSGCLLYTSPSPRDRQKSRMPSSA